MAEMSQKPIKETFQVIWRHRRQGMNWNRYVEARDASEAEYEARLLLAYDRYHDLRDLLGLTTAERDWEVAEINQLTPEPPRMIVCHPPADQT